MNLGRFPSFAPRSLVLIAATVLLLPVAFAQATDQGPKQDMKDAGSDTKHAAKSVGHGVSQGTKTGVDKLTNKHQPPADNPQR